MADRNRRFTVAAIALPLLFLAMSGIGRAAGTVTNCTTFGPGAGTLEAALTGGGSVTFTCSGTIIVPQIDISSGTTTVDGAGQSVTLSGNHIANTVFSVASGATLNLQNLIISNGLSFDAGGGGISNDGTVTVTNSTFSGNSAFLGDGGAIRNRATLTVTNSTFSGNGAAILGGGIENLGSLTVTNSTFSGNNVGDSGGGIENLGSLTVTNSTFSGNNALGDSGGGIENLGSLTVTNSTFSGNNAAAGLGGGIHNIGTATLKSTILADESGGNCGGTATPRVTDEGYNISDDGSCGFKMAPSGTSINNSMTLHMDPAGLANNGGPTQTIALEPNSQAVDFIPVADCTDQSMPPVALTTDQRGFPRPDPGNPDFCDAGAFELTTMPFVLAPNSERLQIARSTTPNSDQVNMAFTFTENGFPSCDAGDNAFNGFSVLLRSGSCGALDDASLDLMLQPWVVHTVNHMSYGTIFQSMPPETVSARMVQLPTPASPACGEWTINIEVAGIDSSGLGDGPFALVLSNPDGDQGCFDITNAVVGSQIPTPGHKVRRRVRR